MNTPTGRISRIGTLKTLLQRFAFLSLILITFALMLIGKADTVLVERARTAMSDAVVPLLSVMSEPASAISKAFTNFRELASIREENVRLREENNHLQQWQVVAKRLETANLALNELLVLSPEPAISYITARVVGDTGGAFAQSMLTTAGSEHGVDKGQAVIAGEGLVGRVSQVGRRSSRVLLISDINSRIPVLVGDSGLRAMLAGDNSNRPRLLFLDTKSIVSPGDPVVTSGAAGAFLPGIPVGQVVRVEENLVQIEPYVARNRITHIRIVDFGLGEILSELNSKQ